MSLASFHRAGLMITLRCTKRLLKYLEVDPVKQPPPATGNLGDWYANLVSTHAGDLVVFVSERTLLTVAVPAREAASLRTEFRARVRNLLAMIDVSSEAAERELSHYQEIRFSTTASRSVLGSLNDIAYNYQAIAEDGNEDGWLSLSDAEKALSLMPSIARGFFPDEEARRLLEIRSSSNRDS